MDSSDLNSSICSVSDDVQDNHSKDVISGSPSKVLVYLENIL